MKVKYPKIGHHLKKESQIDLASDIYSTFKEDSILLAEAGTGLGKSLAYLSAGVLYSKKEKYHFWFQLTQKVYRSNYLIMIFQN